MKNIFRLWILVIVSFIFSSFSYAQTSSPAPVGLVVWVTGEMKAVSSHSGPRVLSRRSPVYVSDTIMTGSDGSGEIVFSDNSVVSLRQETVLEIAQYHFNKNQGGNNEVLNLIKGGFRTITGMIAKESPQAYRAKTPVATIGVAGTVYSAYFDAAAQSLFTKLDTGIVYVSNGTGKITLTKTSAPHSNCALDMYSQVSSSGSPQVICDEPKIFLSDPPLIPVSFPQPGGASGGVGSFCVS